MFVSLISQFTEHVQFLIVFISLVFLWFKQREDCHIHRSTLIITVSSMILAHIMVHAFDRLWFHALPPRFFIENNAINQGWEAFYLQWYRTPSSIATWVAFAIGMFHLSRVLGLLLFCLALAEGWLHLVAGLVYPSDILYATVIGVLCGSLLHGLSHHLRRATEGVQQMCQHIPQIMYPLILLMMIDMDNDLRFITATYYFMFGQPIS